MQIRLFIIPLVSSESEQEELNHFLRSHKIVDVKKELAIIDGNSVWTFCVTYLMSGKPVEFAGVDSRSKRIDYKSILDDASFARFQEMRKLRKTIAESEAIPAYAVFSDAELAEMAKQEKLTIEQMRKIDGIGNKKIEKYGDTFCNSAMLKGNEESGTSD